MKRLAVYCLLFVLFSAFVKNSNNSLSELIRSKLDLYSKNNWPEKIYVHTDKALYTLNEDIWFSAYLVNGITHKKSTKSSVVYVELINNKDSVLETKRLYLNDLSTAGNFKINSHWTSGNYLIRAYTNYMRNEDPSIFFQKEIKIVSLSDINGASNNETTTLIKETDVLVKPQLEFFPEGGDLVENINTKVAVKVKDINYQNYKIPIEIVDANGSVISKFNTAEFGMGYFHISPKRDSQYFANLNLNGQFYQYPLPIALKEGYGLNINFKKDQLLIRLSSNKQFGLKSTYVLVHQRGKILFDKFIDSNKQSEIFSIYKGNLEDGVTHITLFNSEGQPVSERLVFIENPQNKNLVLIDKNKGEFESREKVALGIQLKSKAGKDLSGNLSMSVRDLGAIPWSENDHNIKTWLLLNSDLRGKIENPGYFFTEGDRIKKDFLLDLIMMTNGWRRFTWQSILEGENKANTYKVEKGINISGTTRMLEPPNKEVSTINTITFISGQTIDRRSVNSKQNGKFSFGPYVFYDSIPTLVESKLIDTTVKTKDNYRDVLISIDEKIIDRPEIYRNKEKSGNQDPTVLNADFLETSNYMRQVYLDYDQERQRLDEIVLTVAKKTKAEERQDEMNKRSIFGSPSRRLDFESDKFSSQTQLRFVIQNIPGIRVGGRNVFYRGEPTLIMYNNMRVDLDFVNNMSPEEVSFIDFYDPSVAYQSGATGGVIVIFGKLGVDKNYKTSSKQPGIINFIAKGFDSPKQFYAPDYSKDLDQMTVTDVRTTLHWEPIIRLTSDQATQDISFYTCDMKGTYLIEIEGMTDTGIPVQGISYFYVN